MFGIGNISQTLNDVLKPFDGLGKPTIKLEFEDNAQLADFLKDSKESKQYARYTDVTASDVSPNTATDAKAKARSNGKLMPADDSTTPEPPTASALPPTKTPPPLPPAPTAKALPEHKGNWTINDIVEYSRKKIGKKYVLFEDASSLKYQYSYLWYLDLVVSNKEICILLRYNNYQDNGIKQYIDIDTNCANAKEFWQKNSKAFDLAKQLINVSPLVWRILQIYRPLKDAIGMNYNFDYKDFQLQYWFDDDNEFYHQGFICRISIDNFVKQLEKSIVSIFLKIDKVNDDDRWDMYSNIVLANDIITYVKGNVPSGLSFNNYTFDYTSINGDIYKDGDFFAVKIPSATNEPQVVKFTPKKPKHQKPEILGKPTIKLEFKDNDELMSLFDTDGINGHTVNDKPAAVFNCPESELDCRGYKPTYKRLADYSHLIDAADGAKTLKGYGFEKSTLNELVNACKQYKQVERLAAHLKDDDQMQSAFNIWHWLHTNIKYNYDTPGEEEIRTPARTWADRKSGVDCDCLAVFTACLLLNMGYKPCFEIVAFNNSPKFSHIYVNLDGAAIDRVLPVFLQRPANITKTKIMEIPVYELSGVGLCDNSLSGVYNSTLAKIQSGTASGDDNNNYRKMQVLVTLKGIDDAASKLAALLMPYVLTVGDDGVYYFDNSNVAALAKKLDAELKALKIQGADDTMISNWLTQAATQLKNASGTPDGEDTIVIIINPKGDSTNVQGKMVSTNLQTLSPMSQDAIAQSNNAASSSTLPAVMQTTAAPQKESSGNSTVWWLVGGLVLGLGLSAMAKRR